MEFGLDLKRISKVIREHRVQLVLKELWVHKDL
jgi:hypothetical protein